MSKSLEALENIRREAGFPYFSTLYDIDMWREDFATVEKELKALEIIKPCCIVADYKCENPEDRYELAFCRKICITEEEYNLLKEVLK